MAAQAPIDLYYWPTPNGWKITIMLEECTLPYAMIPLDISKGDQFKRECLAISPNKLGLISQRLRRTHCNPSAAGQVHRSQLCVDTVL